MKKTKSEAKRSTCGYYLKTDLKNDIALLANAENEKPSIIVERVLEEYVIKHQKQLQELKTKAELKKVIDEQQGFKNIRHSLTSMLDSLEKDKK